MMNILQLIANLQCGGVERSTLEIAQALVAAGHNAWVASPKGELVSAIEKAGASYIKLTTGSKNPFVIFISYLRLLQIVKKQKIDIIHAHSRQTAWLALLVCKITGCKLATSLHGWYNQSNFLIKFYNSGLLRGDRIIAISKFISDIILCDYQKYIDPQKLVLINRSIDPFYFNPEHISAERVQDARQHLDNQTEQKPVILYPSRICEGKGHLYLLDLLDNLQAHHWVCYIVGYVAAEHQQYMQKIIAKIESLSLQKRVLIRSQWHDMPALYAVCDIVMLTPELPEAFGRIITEAQAMQKLVIATASGGALELIKHGQNGFQIAPDEDAATAASIVAEALHLSAPEYEQITTQGREDAIAYHNKHQMCQQTIALYEELGKGRSH